MIGVYKIQNQINGKCYIGQSRNIHKRWNTHRNAYKNPKDNRYDTPLYRAMRKYGIQHFDFTILEECDIESLNRLERQYITQYDSFWNGYNCSFGGENGGTNQVQKNVVRGIIDDLATTDMKHREIAEKWKVSTEMVQGINTGRYWRSNREYPIQKHHQRTSRPEQRINCTNKHSIPRFCVDCGAQIWYSSTRCADCAAKHRTMSYAAKRPSKEQLSALLSQYHSFKAVAEVCETSDTSIRNWCKQYNLSTNINTYI